MNIEKLKEFKSEPISYWIDSTRSRDYPILEDNIHTDIAIVGGGIAGLTVAYQLQKSDKEVAVIEGEKIAQGTTGRTTAKITSQHNLIYGRLVKQFGKDIAKQYAMANELAIKKIKKIADENNIDCDYSNQPAFVYTKDENFVEQIKEEVAIAKSFGIEASYVEEIPFSIPIKGDVRFNNQAQFHPRKFLLPLAKLIHNQGGKIYEHSRIVSLEENKDGKYLLTTSGGHTVTASKVIIASHYPFYNKLGAYYSRISQAQTYAIVIKAKEEFPGGMFINAEQPNRSLRGLNIDSGEYILVVGDSHRTGGGNNTNKHYEALIDFASNLFTIEDIPYRWSTEDCMTVDGVPYIGKLSQETPNLYVTTGFNKWGITNSLVSSLLLKDLIIKGASPWDKVYNPSRGATPSTTNELKNKNLGDTNGQSGSNTGTISKISDVKKGEGKIIEKDDKRFEVFRDDDEKLHIVSLICTHMGCEVNWNPGEKTWDCPCHGSRYDIDGEVINGPAVHSLNSDQDTNIITKLIEEDF